MSQVVIHGGTVYMSGQVSTGDGIAAQTQGCLDKIDALLAQVNNASTEHTTSKSRLLTAQIWVKDMERDFAGMNQVWNAWLDPEHKPVRACTQADLARDHFLVEIQVTAALE